MSDQNCEKDQLIARNIGLVHMVLKRYYQLEYEKEELFQVGCVGLVKAANRFDASFGYAFSTYAVPVIAGEIARFLRDDNPVHISRGDKEKAIRLKGAREKLQEAGISNPTMSQLARESGLNQEELLVAMEAQVSVDTLDRTVSKENETTLLEVFAGKERESCAYERVENSCTVQALLNTLEGRERRLIYLRYVEGKSQMETAKLLKSNQPEISRTEKKILLHLREFF